MNPLVIDIVNAVQRQRLAEADAARTTTRRRFGSAREPRTSLPADAPTPSTYLAAI
jgi:hypothetical protein